MPSPQSTLASSSTRRWSATRSRLACPLGRCSLLPSLRRTQAQSEDAGERWPRGSGRKGVIFASGVPKQFSDMAATAPATLSAVCLAIWVQASCTPGAPAVEMNETRAAASRESVAIERKRLEEMIVGEVSDRVHNMSEDQLLDVLEELLRGAPPDDKLMSRQTGNNRDTQIRKRATQGSYQKSSTSGFSDALPSTEDASRSNEPPTRSGEASGFQDSKYQFSNQQQLGLRGSEGLRSLEAPKENFPLSSQIADSTSPSETDQDAKDSTEESISLSIEHQLEAMMSLRELEGEPQVAGETGGETPIDSRLPGMSSQDTTSGGDLIMGLLPELQRRASQVVADSIGTLLESDQETSGTPESRSTRAGLLEPLVDLLPENIDIPRAIAAGKTAIIGGTVMWVLLWIPQFLEAVKNSAKSTISRLPWMPGLMVDEEQGEAEGSNSASRQPMTIGRDQASSIMRRAFPPNPDVPQEASPTEAPEQEIWASYVGEGDESYTAGEGVLWRRDDNDSLASYQEYSQFVPNWVVEGDTSGPVPVPSVAGAEISNVSDVPSEQGLEMSTSDEVSESILASQEGRLPDQYHSSINSIEESCNTPSPGAPQSVSSSGHKDSNEGNETSKEGQGPSAAPPDQGNAASTMDGPEVGRQQQTRFQSDRTVQTGVLEPTSSTPSQLSETNVSIDLWNRAISLWSNVDPPDHDQEASRQSWRLYEEQHRAGYAVPEELDGSETHPEASTLDIEKRWAGASHVVKHDRTTREAEDQSGRSGMKDESLVFGNVDKLMPRRGSTKLLRRLLRKS